MCPWLVQTPVTQISGIRARNGHFGKPPPTGGISPQSQMVPSTLSCWNTCTSPCGCCGETSVPATSVGASVSIPATLVDEANWVSPSATGATEAAEDFDAVSVVLDTLGSCETARRRMRCSWPPFCRSPITFTTSANLIGLACVGTATRSSKLIKVAIGRNTRVLILVRNSLLKTFQTAL